MNRLGSNFVVVVSREVMAVVMEVVSDVFKAVHLRTEQNISLRNKISYNLHVLFFSKYETQGIT